jgi:hypothetical protein
MPETTPSWLSNQQFYEAIYNEYWCYWPLRNAIKNFNFSGIWWNVEFNENSSFPQESEYIPLCVEYSSGQDVFTGAQSYVENLASGKGLTVADGYDKDESDDTDGFDNQLPYMSWCIYKSSWVDEPPDDVWEDGTYLRDGGLKTEYMYGGAVVLMSCVAKTPVVAKYTTSSLKSETVITQSQQTSTSISQEAVSKPLGSLGDGITPCSASMILPVFTESKIIPLSMHPVMDEYPVNEDDYYLMLFLMWLKDVTDIDNPATAPPAGTENYLAALQKLNSQEWRYSGYNPNMQVIDAYDSADYPDGAGWLQQGSTYIYNDSDEITGIDDSTSNEETVCDPPTSGWAPNLRSGPSRGI